MKLFAKLTDLPDGHRDIIPDMQKRYSGTFMKYKDGCVFIGSLYNDTTFTVGTKNGDNFLLNTNEEDKGQLSPFLPKSGYYNMEGNPVYIAKKPERQWRRSFSKHIYQVLGPMHEMVHPQIGTGFWWNLAEETLNPEYVSLDNINHRIFANVALNLEFAVVLYNKTPWLVYKRYPIAKLNIASRTITMTQNLLRQEVVDLLKRTGAYSWKLQ